MEPFGFYKGKNVTVTGGLGFLGSNIARRLVALGSRVTVVDCILEGHGGNPFNLDGVLDKVTWVKGDICNRPLMQNVLKNQDLLFNIAAQTSHTDSMKNPSLDAEINIKGQINILEICRELNPAIKIVYCSTRAVYGATGKTIIDEETNPNPLDIYSVDKLAGEFYHQIYCRVYGLNTTVLRLANGYGPRAQMANPSFGILNWFIRLAIGNEDIKIFGDGKQVRDYTYIDDIVESFLIAGASENLKGEVLNVGSGVGVPLINIVKDVVRLAGKGNIVYVPWPETNKKIDVGDFIADVTKVKSKLSWAPKISMEEGIKKTLEYYEAHKRNYW